MTIPTCVADDPRSWIKTLMGALDLLAETHLQEEHPADWDEINTAMAWTAEALGITDYPQGLE